MQATGMKCHPVQLDVRKVRKHYLAVFSTHTIIYCDLHLTDL